MRDFLWNYFSKTGEIDVYLLYKEHEAVTKGNCEKVRSVAKTEHI